MNRRQYMVGVLTVASLAGCTSSNSSSDSQEQTDTDESDLFVRYNVEMIRDAHAPPSLEGGYVSEGPHAVFATVIENRTSELLPLGDREERLEPLFAPQPALTQVWSVFDDIPAGEEEKGHYVYATDSMDANPSLVAASDRYEVALERDENIAVETELFQG